MLALALFGVESAIIYSFIIEIVHEVHTHRHKYTHRKKERKKYCEKTYHVTKYAIISSTSSLEKSRFIIVSRPSLIAIASYAKEARSIKHDGKLDANLSAKQTSDSVRKCRPYK